QWIDNFMSVLSEIDQRSKGIDFMEKVTSTFYNDDLMVFTPSGQAVVMPQKSSVLDFAYEISTETGRHAKYARVNGFLSSVKEPLHRGDVVEIFTDEGVNPSKEQKKFVVTYKAKKAIDEYLNSLPVPKFHRCDVCNPIPGEEVVGFYDNDGRLTIHKRDCPIAIRLASQFGDDIQSVDFEPDHTLYPVVVSVKAIDRFHLFLDIVDCISNRLNLNIDEYNSECADSIVTSEISFGVHSYEELKKIMEHIRSIKDVDEVKWRVR
ncbi:MAG: TGS domain-containing protein, partial [Muribaculaceae bacterium]|nr:TGS domain-containing protein [Muribaculaceae bacterium]